MQPNQFQAARRRSLQSATTHEVPGQAGMRGSQASLIPESQGEVNAHFAATLQHWRKVYERSNVFSIIYNERRLKALALIDEMNLAPEARVLEIGCGPGLITADLARRGFRVQAIDSVAGMVQATQRELAERGLAERASVSVGDVHSLEFADNGFDVVVIVGVTEWLPDLRRPLSEVARVLKPNGALVVAADNKWALHLLLDPFRTPLTRPLRRAAGKVLRAAGLRRQNLKLYDYGAGELGRLLAEAGLTKGQAATLGFGPFSLGAWLLAPGRSGRWLHRRLQRLADRGVPLLRSAGLTHLMVARKG